MICSRNVSRVVIGGLSLFAAVNASALVGEEIIYYHNDGLGSPVLATNASGDVLWREAYSPYGSRLIEQSREKNCETGVCVPVESIWDERQWFTGKVEETRTGIQYFGARWYEPEIGRFLSIDPLQFRDDNIFSFNSYAYANGNPYKYIDPDGRDSITVTGTIHVPGSLLHFFGVGEVPISGFSGGIAVSFPGPWSPGADFNIGLVGSANIPSVDVGLGKASVDIGYNKGSFSDLSGDSVEASATVGRYNAGVNWDADSGELTGIKVGMGVALGKLSKTFKNAVEGLKNGQVRSAFKGVLNNNASLTYQKNRGVGIRGPSSGSDAPGNRKRHKEQ